MQSTLPSKTDGLDGTLNASSEEDDTARVSASRTCSEETHISTSTPGALQFPSHNQDTAKSARKRKHSYMEDDLEGRYLSQLAREGAKEQVIAQSKRPKHQVSENPGDDEGASSSSQQVEAEGSDEEVPQHEAMAASLKVSDLEKSSRTVFLANVSTLAIKSKTAKKVLLEHLVSFSSSPPDQSNKHQIESLRFRSTAFANNAAPRKAAFAKKELMDTTTQSTNAYVVYTTSFAAREASRKLNGSIVLDRHLRVDLVAHPAKIDHRRCVFVGNLGFVDDMTNINKAEDEENEKSPRKAKEPADVEEGLWRQFSKAGIVESVRVVRDKTTRVGKGFAYVQFEAANSVEKALLYNEKKFPPMLPRILRVTRAKNVRKAAAQKETGTHHRSKAGSSAVYKPKTPAQIQSFNGRAGKLLGRAGAAKFRTTGKGNDQVSKVSQIGKSPETIVFEGYRASRRQGKGTPRIGGSGKSQGKPRTRSSRRGAEFKAKGRKSART